MFNSRLLLSLFLFLVLSAPSIISAQTSSAVTPVSFSFKLDSSATTSAGVYQKDGTLLRTLWSGVKYSAGSHIEKWDGLDDQGKLVSDKDIEVKVLSNNVTYEWEGSQIGNTGTYTTGTQKMRTGGSIRGIVVIGDVGYIAPEYNESYTAYLSMSVSHPYDGLNVLEGYSQYPMVASQICSDGVRVYSAGFDPNGGTGPSQGVAGEGYMETYVVAHYTSDNSLVPFSAGEPMDATHGISYQNVISHKNTYCFVIGDPNQRDVSLIQSIAVQKNGNYLFVSRTGQNELQILNKVTGALVQTLTISGVDKLVVDMSDNLWVAHGNTIEKYIVNSSTGAITSTGVTITSVTTIGALACSPDGTTLAVADMDTQIVRLFNINTLAQTGTIGTPGGYLNSPDVTNYKFYWKDIRQVWVTFLAYLPDGTIYVGDVENNRRTLHFTANGTYIDYFGWQPATYGVGTVANNPARLFSEFQEYRIDYSKPLGARNGSWTLTKNWRALIGSEIFIDRKIGNIVQLSNGRTYALCSGTGQNINRNYVVELVEGVGVRNTGKLLEQREGIGADGNKYTNPEGRAIGIPSHSYKYPLLNFDGFNNPIWSSTPELLATTPNGDVHDPPFGGGITPAGDIVCWNPQFETVNDNLDFHLGVIKRGTNQYLWKTARGTKRNAYNGPFPQDGAFDNGNGVFYAGGGCATYGNNILWNYHGENWKNSQTNIFNHVDARTGLFVGQFGTTFWEVGGMRAVPFMDGNAQGFTFDIVDGVGYIYHNGETFGIHRIKVTGLNSIQIQTATLTSSLAGEQGIDLLEGITWDMTTIPDGFHGWTMPAYDGFPYTNHILTQLGTRSNNITKHPDVLLSFQEPSGTTTWSRSLGNNSNVSSWKLSLVANFEYHGFTQPEYRGGGVLAVMDKSGKAIARFLFHENRGVGIEVLGNNSILKLISYAGTDDDLYASKMVNKNAPLEINYTNGVLHFKWDKYTATSTDIIEAGADWRSPASMQWIGFCSNPGDNLNRNISIQQGWFSTSNTIATNSYRTKTSGNWNDLVIWEHTIDNVTWKAAEQLPTINANSITIQKGHAISITDSAIVDNVLIENGGILNILPNAALTINDGDGDDITIEQGGQLVVKSDETGTGRIGNSSGTIKGSVTVERYIPAKTHAGYRLLSPTVTTQSSIKSNWQEGTNNSNVLVNNNPYIGYGTHITGSTNGANGFDATTTGQASLFTFKQDEVTQPWVSINNTDVNTLDGKKGYLIFIKGNRSVDINGDWPATSTTLRATGSLPTGTVEYKNQESNGRCSIIGNPYASPIDWKKVLQDNQSNFENYYTFWDPSIGSKGGYVTVDATGTTSVRTSAATTEIQSGQAFLVKAKSGVASPTFFIKENHKSLNNNINVFRTTGGAVKKLYTSLYYTNEKGERSLEDGILARFDDNYLPLVDGDDAEDIANFDENIAFNRNGDMLSIESRPMATTTDTLFLSLSNMKQQAYEWQFNASDFDTSIVNRAFLRDKYLNTETPIALTGSTIIKFDITVNAASSASNRFSIIFKPVNSLPVHMISVSAKEQNNGIMVNWKTASEINMNNYQVEKSNDGQLFSIAATLSAKGPGSSINNYNWFDGNPQKGYNYYRIRSVSLDGSIQYSSIVRVELKNSSASSVSFFPIPLKGEFINVRLTNLEKGTYKLKLINMAGQTMLTENIEYAGGLDNQKIAVNKNIPNGVYQLQLNGVEKTFIQQIIKL